jgi:hypothetical protein
MTRTVLILGWAAASLAAKDRAWQTGQLMNKTVNPYFRVAPVSNDSGPTSTATTFGSGDNGALAVKPHAAEGDVSYDNYVIASPDTVYLVEFAHFKTFQAPNISPSKAVTFAVEKDKLWILDLDRREFETKIIKQVEAHPGALAVAGQTATPPADQVKAEQLKAEQAKVERAKSSKPDTVFATAALTSDAPSKPAPVAKPAPLPAPAKVDAKPEAALEASVTKPAQRPQREAKPDGPVARASTKDRAWQAGQLLSVPNNNYFFNVTYTSDLEGSAWAFAQGSDGRLTVTSRIAGVTDTPYTYDNFAIESPFVAYLVQRMRPKTSPPVRLPGTQPLKFAVDKGKMWVLDEQGVEYETKVIKLLQKDAIVDPLTRASR